MQNTTTIFSKAVMVMVVCAVVAVLGVAGYRFWYHEDFSMLLEAPCNARLQSCFVRDCSVEDCPPNGLETYRVFSVPAHEFALCADDTCLAECTAGKVACTEQMCGASAGDTCSK